MHIYLPIFCVIPFLFEKFSLQDLDSGGKMNAIHADPDPQPWRGVTYFANISMQKLIFQQNHFSLFIRDPGGFDSYTVTQKCSIRGCMCSEFLKLWSKDEWKHLQVAFVYTVNKRMSSLSVYVLLSVRTLTVLGVLVLVLLSKLCCRRRFMIVHIPTSTGNRNHPSKKTCSFMSFIPILDVKKAGRVHIYKG